MSKVHVLNRFLIGTALAAGIPAALAWATTNSGSTSTLVGRATFKSFRVERKQLPAKQSATGLWAGEADRARRRRPIWEVEVEARPGLDVATQTITFQPGGHSGWHSHPGPVFISVLSGTMTFYESDDPDSSPSFALPVRGTSTPASTLTSPATRPHFQRPTSSRTLCRRARRSESTSPFPETVLSRQSPCENSLHAHCWRASSCGRPHGRGREEM